MKYRVLFTEGAKKELKKLDRHTAALIIGWIEKNLEGCENPRAKGKGLTANRSGQWRYRVGDYRILAEIEDDKIIIMIISSVCSITVRRTDIASKPENQALSCLKIALRVILRRTHYLMSSSFRPKGRTKVQGFL